MNKRKIRLFVIALIVLALAIGGTAAGGVSQLSLFGKYFGDARTSDKNNVVATYGDHQVTQKEIDYHKAINSEVSQNESDRDITNKIIAGYILLEEAEREGLAATDAEIDEMVAMTKEAYNTPEGKTMIDEYCNSAGITVDEYFDIIGEQAYDTITRQKLRNKFDEKYCEEYEIQYGNFSEETYAEITKAYNEYRDSLLESHKCEIAYNLS